MNKERPILFNTEMVKAILAGKKTMTRRAIKSIGNEMHYTQLLGDWALSGSPELKDDVLIWELQTDVDDSGWFETKCPYGQVGDILWVRETWAIHDLMLKPRKLSTSNQEWFYKKKFEPEMAPHVKYLADYSKGAWPGAWRPSIHMPRIAARLFLKITDIRVERLQDITETDAKSEGIRAFTKDGELYKYSHTDDFVWSEGVRTAKEAFQSLWDGIYSKNGLGWDINPWLWVVEFEVITA